MTRVACEKCGAADAIDLSRGDPTSVTCGACGVRQARREYEIQRVKADFVRARAAASRAISEEPTEEAVCPVCGDELFTREHGCPKCGHGRPTFVARHRQSLPMFGALATLFIGGCGVGSTAWISPANTTNGVLLADVIFVLTGSFLFGFGVRALEDPTSLMLAQSTGQDAFGVNQYGPSRRATSEQGSSIAFVCLLLGVTFTVLAVFIGTIARSLGMLD